MIYNLCQFALLRCEHPSAEILFPTKYSVSPLHKKMLCRLIQGALLRYKHPSSPILLDPKYSIFSLHRWMLLRLTQDVLLRCKHPIGLIVFPPKYWIFLTQINLFQIWSALCKTSAGIDHSFKHIMLFDFEFIVKIKTSNFWCYLMFDANSSFPKQRVLNLFHIYPITILV